MPIRLRPSSIGWPSAARRILVTITLCATVLVPMELLGTTTLGAAGPSTSVAAPSNGATVSDDIWLNATASAGTASVSFEVNGSSIIDEMVSSSVSWEYGWLGAWDTRDVPNGSYTLKSVATNTSGVSTTSAPVTVSVDNPPPSTTVIIPATSGATLDAAAGFVLDAVASAGATSVTFDVAAVPLTATPTIYGWIYVMPATPPCSGQPVGSPVTCPPLTESNSLQSVATYAGGVSVTSPTLSENFIVYPPECCLP